MRRFRAGLGAGLGAGLLTLPGAAGALPLRVQADFGLFEPGPEAVYGESGARFLHDFGSVDRPEQVTDPAFGLALSVLPVEGLEVGLSARRLSTSLRYAVTGYPEIAQTQDTELTPLVAFVGLRGGSEWFEGHVGAGVGGAFTHVSRRGYLDDGEADDLVLCGELRVGGAFQLPAGLDVGGQLTWTALTLPSTRPLFPIEPSDRGARAVVLALTLGWQSPGGTR